MRQAVARMKGWVQAGRSRCSAAALSVLVFLTGLLTVPDSALAAGGYKFNITPDPKAPGVHSIQHATNQGLTYVLLACGMGAVASLIILAAAKGAHLERLHNRGKEGLILAVLCAFVAGLLAAILNMAYSLG